MARQQQHQPPQQAIGLIGSPADFEAAIKRGFKPQGWGTPDKPWNPMQLRVLTCLADEIALLGGKGSGKSLCARAWLVTGNPGQPKEDVKGNPILVNRSYIYHPQYRGLILRRNQEDLDDFIARAIEMYKPYGGDYINGRFQFISGATIDCGHMKDRNSWQKYLGIEYQRMVIDEAALIPEFESYEQLRSCLRTTDPILRMQMLVTSNANGPGACVPYGDVLTPSGWRDIKSIAVGDSIYTVLEDGSLAETLVSQTHSSHYEGTMATVNMRGFHMACTPNHEVAYIPDQAAHHVVPHQLRRMDKLPGNATILRSVKWQGSRIGSFEPPQFSGEPKVNRLKQPTSISGDLYAQLMGWFLSEGYVLQRERDRLFGITQIKPDHKGTIEQMLKECGFSYRLLHNGFSICSPRWWTYLRQFGTSVDKFIPSALKNSTVDQLWILLTALMDGDGSWGRSGNSRTKRIRSKTSGVYYTISKRLADDVAEVCLKLGFVVYISTRIGRPGPVCGHAEKNPRHLTYQVNFRQPSRGGTWIATGNIRNASKGRKKLPNTEWIEYSGPVYCIGVPETHTFVIRQNGAVWVSGNSWLRERFMRARDKDGKFIPHDTTIFENYEDPDKPGETFVRSRIWIFSTYKDNPTVVKTGYGRQLMTLSDPKMRRAYLEGDWDAFFGSYFSDLFRPEGPHSNEPANASHVIKPLPLTSWWHRSIGMDWGYAHESAVLWGCRDLAGRFYIYRELAASQVSPERMGFEIAKASREELEKLPSHSMVLHLSHDAFQNRTGDRSIAEIIALGIARVLGPNAVHLPDMMMKAVRDAYYQDSNNPMAQQERDRAIEKIRLQKRTGITIRIAEKTGNIGWTHVRELMRWESVGELNNSYDGALAMRILQEGGPAKLNEYVSLHRDVNPEALPKLQIFDSCPRIIDAIPKAQYVDGEEEMDKKHFFGKDLVDSLLYLSIGAYDEFPEEPFEAFREDMLMKLRQREPEATVMSLVLANQEWESQYKNKHTLAPYTPPRQARMRRLLAQGLVPDNRSKIDERFGEDFYGR